ncbi:MAG TPA: hypothetical protein ENJ30_02810 [Desulfobulbaceae bacterium]|nr:hypothetical protein [Desulfobulbaceae bacterium]
MSVRQQNNNLDEDDSFAPMADVMAFVAIIWLVLFVVFSQEAPAPEPVQPERLARAEAAAPPPEIPRARGNKSGTPKKVEISVRFTSRADLVSLIRKKTVALYAVVEEESFQMFFKAETTTEGGISFAVVEEAPAKKSGWRLNKNDSAYFADALSKDYPGVRKADSFQIVLYFEADDLGEKVEDTIAALNNKKTSATLFIDRQQRINIRRAGD